jgi:dUTP pyrophosphatase
MPPEHDPICYAIEHVTVRLEIRFLDRRAKRPFRKRETDAGFDLHALNSILLPVGQATIVETGLAIACPPGFYYTMEGRSSLWLQGIFPNRGIIDASYNGPLVVSLVNVSDKPYQVHEGDRIAQMLLHRQLHARFDEVEAFSSKYDQRGQAGFGSSGR